MKKRWVRVVCIVVLLSCLPLTSGRAQAAGGGENPQVAPPGTSDILAIPAAAFLPGLPEINYENHGQYLYNLNTNTAAEFFVAGVELPHGALINQLSFCFYDDSASKAITATLYHRAFQGAGVEMASTSSTSLANKWETRTTSSITDPLVDNVHSIYYIQFLLPVSSQTAGDDLRICGATIRYNRPAQPTGILAIPAVSLTLPVKSSLADRVGGSLLDRSPFGGYYMGAVNLPGGAQVTKLTLRYKDSNNSGTPSNATLDLIARDNANAVHTMASVTTSDSSEEVETSDVTIDPTYAQISNQTQAYYVWLHLPESKKIQGADYLWVTAILIEYTLPGWSRDRVLHIPPAAFRSFHDDVVFTNGAFLLHLAGYGQGEPYVAPVYLPQGAKITYVNFKFYDGSSETDGTAVMTRVHWQEAATLVDRTTSGSPGNVEGMLAVDPDYEIVDNANYRYFVYYYLPVSSPHSYPTTGDVAAIGVRVYYQETLCTYLPVVRMQK